MHGWPRVQKGAAYNRAMRAVTPLLLLALATGSVLAQPASTTPVAEPSPRSPEQRTQRIRVEDQGSRVDELRVGGETKRITVQPKTGDMPAYEVQTSDGERNRSRNGAETNTGSRVWSVMKF